MHVVQGGGRPLAASVTLSFREGVEVPWAGGLRRYRHLAGVMLLYWSMLCHAQEQGATRFDFGRGTPGSGSFRFKTQWGGTREVLPWYYVSASAEQAPSALSTDNPRYALAIRLWQRLPVSVARTLGAQLARWLP